MSTVEGDVRYPTQARGASDDDVDPSVQSWDSVTVHHDGVLVVDHVEELIPQSSMVACASLIAWGVRLSYRMAICIYSMYIIMSNCDALPKCAARNQSCQRPNSWNIFLMAHSSRGQTAQNTSIVEKSANIKAKARVYKHLKETQSPLFRDTGNRGVVSGDNVALCRMYRQLKKIEFPVVPVVPVVQVVPVVPVVPVVLVVPVVPLVPVVPVVPVAYVPVVQSNLPPLRLARGDTETQQWARRLVTGDWPATYNKVYGFTMHRLDVIPLEGMMIEHLKRLRHDGGMGSWLSATIIDCFTSIVRQHSVSQPSPRRTFLLFESSFFMKGQVSIDTLPKARLMKKYGQTTVSCGLSAGELPQVSLFPYNLSGNHWILMVYDHVATSWYSYDSLGGDHYAVAANYHKHMMDMMALRDAFSYKRQDVPYQTDGYQCGVWTCIFAMCTMTGTRLPDRATSDPSAYSESARLYIAKTMHTNTVSLVRDPDVDLRTSEWPQRAIT